MSVIVLAGAEIAEAISRELDTTRVITVSSSAELLKRASEAKEPHLLIDASMGQRDEVVAACQKWPATVVVDADQSAALSALLPATIQVLIAGSPPPLIGRQVRIAVDAAFHRRDGLTGLLDRADFWRTLEQRLQQPGPHALAMFDVDHFKRINDEHGHLVGDRILVALARLLEQTVQPPADVARIGGEEFGVYLPRIEASAAEIVRRVLAAVREHPVDGIGVRLSAGLAAFRPGSNVDSLAREADEALYSAKAAGRDRLVSHTELVAAARANHRDVSLEAFESRTRVIAERVAEAITARGRKLFGELQERADVDAVTGLFSRGYLDRRLSFELEQASASGAPITIALADLDHFHDVNATYGWPTGDEALRAVSEALKANVRTTDWVARYGGEELCVVMFGTSIDDASAVLERLVTAVSELELESTDGRGFNVTVSIGAATAKTGERPLDLLERASSCLLTAKRAGRNRLAT